MDDLRRRRMVLVVVVEAELSLCRQPCCDSGFEECLEVGRCVELSRAPLALS